jgi:hypothetical protein
MSDYTPYDSENKFRVMNLSAMGIFTSQMTKSLDSLMGGSAKTYLSDVESGGYNWAEPKNVTNLTSLTLGYMF